MPSVTYACTKLLHTSLLNVFNKAGIDDTRNLSFRVLTTTSLSFPFVRLWRELRATPVDVATVDCMTFEYLYCDRNVIHCITTHLACLPLRFPIATATDAHANASIVVGQPSITRLGGGSTLRRRRRHLRHYFNIIDLVLRCLSELHFVLCTFLQSCIQKMKKTDVFFQSQRDMISNY